MQTTSGKKQRFGAYGDFWARYLNWGVRHCPWALEPILLAFYTTLFFIAFPPFRRGIMANLRVLFPGAPSWRNGFRSYRVLWNFASVAVDGVRAREDPGIIEWEVHGISHFHKLSSDPGGAILATAHMGNYDLAGPAFEDRFDRPVHAVRAPERTPELQAIRKRDLEIASDGRYRIIYNEPGNMLAITLTQALSRGEIVAIQADRILFEVSAIAAEWDARHTLDVPQGPFILAQAAKCPIYPIFIIRLGRCRYRVQVMEPFTCPRTSRPRAEDLKDAADHWGAILYGVAHEFWYQWLLVESNFKSKEGR